MNSVKKISLSFLLFIGSLPMISQVADNPMVKKHDEKPFNFWDRFYAGGNIGLQFGTVTFADISPLVGYKITPKLSVGVGATYQYYHYKDRNIDFTTDVYGGRVFGRYFFTDYLFGHAEYEYLNLEAFDFQRRRVDVNSVMAGGGYFQSFGGRAGLSAMLLYNFTPSMYTPYANPIFRIGFVMGI